MWYKVEHPPTKENVQRLIEAASIVEPEFVTVIRLSHQAGIKSGINRHLGPADFRDGTISFQHPLGLGPIRRTLSPDLAEYLGRLSTDGRTKYCPRLDELSNDHFANAYRDVCAEAGFKIPLIALIWPYEKSNKERINFERALSYIEALATQWLTPEEQKFLQAKQKQWVLMGSKRGNRKRRLTRAQILAPFKNNVNPSAEDQSGKAA